MIYVNGYFTTNLIMIETYNAKIIKAYLARGNVYTKHANKCSEYHPNKPTTTSMSGTYVSGRYRILEKVRTRLSTLRILCKQKACVYKKTRQSGQQVRSNSVSLM